jgi:prolyl oligopeptidase
MSSEVLMMTPTYGLMLAAILGALAADPPKTPAEDDPYLWLEEVEGERALAWVRERNARSLARLEKDPRYAPTEKAVRAIILAKDRLPSPSMRGGWVYNFWQDEKNVRGLWRRTKLDEYRKEQPQWQTILDIDELAKREGENWVYKGASCLAPDYDRCLLTLSRGGKDASVVREFLVSKGEFVKDGFELPEAKSRVSWIDADTVFVGTDFGPGSLTSSGYPRLVKVWKRGTPLAKAATVFEGHEKDVAVSGYTMYRPEGNVSVVVRTPAFFEEENHIWADGKLRPVPLPRDANLSAVFEGRLFAQLRSEWKPGPRVFPAGAFVALPLDTLDVTRAESVLEPTAHTSIQGLAFTRSSAYAILLEDVKGRITELQRDASGRWTATPQAYPDHGSLTILSSDDFDEEMLVDYSTFLVPRSIYYSPRAGTAPAVIKRAPARFDANGLTVEQGFATSKDGTRIPYFVVRSDTLRLDGEAPTLLDAYGGFEIPVTPYYLNDTGKFWLEKGGVFVIANIRGGGEYGPGWHKAGLKENRTKVFEDHVAVAEDLIARKITSARRLAINGGSNGGLLVGAAFTRRPDLFRAVVCQVPLLDMLRYSKLLAGASWMAEYGDPDDPKMRAIIRTYSPYQNLAREKKYPEVLFMTSTKDDRVHPGHARKMAARMEELGHPYLYYENIEGGHGAAANLEQQIHRRSLQAIYLYQKLMDAPPASPGAAK